MLNSIRHSRSNIKEYVAGSANKIKTMQKQRKTNMCMYFSHAICEIHSSCQNEITTSRDGMSKPTFSKIQRCLSISSLKYPRVAYFKVREYITIFVQDEGQSTIMHKEVSGMPLKADHNVK